MKPANYDKRLYQVDDYKELAETRFFRHAKDYFNSGANDEVSLQQQYEAFRDLKLVKRVFVDQSKWQGMQTDILGTPINSPICVTSTAFQRMAAPDGEVATARACNKSKTPLVLSSWATSSNEEVGAAAPDSMKVYQIYLSKIKEVNHDIWRRVKESGFKALALTTDTQLLGKRLENERRGFQLPPHLAMQNFAKYVGQENKLTSDGGSGLAAFVRTHKNNEIDWSWVRYIKEQAGLPVFAKGVGCAEDARLACEAGIDGIYVSNHGARQLDTTPATIEVLKEVVDAAEAYAKETGTKRVPIWFDGGLRTGADVLKALALGADLVWIGRPVLWALACEGQTGVENIIRILNEELKEAMLQAGCYSLADVRSKKVLYDKSDLLLGKL